MNVEALIRRANEGDRDAFAALVERHKTPVFNLAYRMLGNRADAEDVAQETFLRAYSKLSTYEPERRFEVWLLSITAHLCIDQLRRKRTVSLESLPFFDRPGADWNEPESFSLEREQRDEVLGVLKLLPDRYRIPLVLRYWYDQSYAEIGRILSLTENAVKTRLFRAREMLAREIERRGGRSNVLSRYWRDDV